MRISQLLTESRVLSELSTTSKPEALALLSEVLAKDIPSSDSENIFNVLQEREQLAVQVLQVKADTGVEEVYGYGPCQDQVIPSDEI